MPYKIKRFTTRFRTARDSGLHRIAVFALYRAILKTCTKVALPENLVSKRGPVNPLVFLVRKGFRRNRGIDHAVLVGRAMGVGHVAYKMFQESVKGNTAVTEQIWRLLWLQEKKREVSAAQPRPVRKERPRVWPYPGAPKLVDVLPKPKEQLGGSGRRIVPKIAEHGLTIFLRRSKPQSPFLSRIIRDRLKVHERGQDALEALREDTEVAGWEEEWDRMTGTKEKEGGGWGREVEIVKEELVKKGQSKLVKDVKRADRWVEIRDQEQKLWEEEREARMAEKKAKWEEKKARRVAEGWTRGDNDTTGSAQLHTGEYDDYVQVVKDQAQKITSDSTSRSKTEDADNIADQVSWAPFSDKSR